MQIIQDCISYPHAIPTSPKRMNWRKTMKIPTQFAELSSSVKFVFLADGCLNSSQTSPGLRVCSSSPLKTL